MSKKSHSVKWITVKVVRLGGDHRVGTTLAIE